MMINAGGGATAAISYSELLEVDTTQGSFETVEDCSVCCIPMTLRIVCHPGRVISIDATP